MVTDDALFTSSATILALAVFGSILGIRVGAKSPIVTKLVRIGAFLAITILIGVQMLFMTTLATNLTLISFEWWIVISGVCSFFITWLMVERPFLSRSG